MLRRAVPVATLALAVTAAGCGSAPEGPQKRRVDFIKRHQKLNDGQLARVCPSLYPSDFLTNTGKYHIKKKDRTYQPTARERADAKAVGCTAQGTKPKN